MGNKSTATVPVNKKRFMEVLKIRNCSIRKLGDAYDEIERTEKTIRRYLDKGEMPPDLLDKIAKFLNVHPDYLSGVYDTKADRIENAYLRSLFQASINPEKFPYLLKARSDINYTSYFENILTMNNITMEQFRTLPPRDRIKFRQEMVVAILQVVAKHFTQDSLGNDLAAELSYCEAFVDDFNPFSYFAHLEGIGLCEDDIEFPLDDGEPSDFETSLQKKYGI